MGNCKILVLTLYLLARFTLALISASAILGSFQKINFQKGVTSVIWNIEFPSAFFHESFESFKKIGFFVEIIAF